MASKSREAWTTVTVKPLGGTLDTRSDTEDIQPGAWRMLLNMRLKDGTKLVCREGFEKLFSSQTPYVNADLHDQGSVVFPAPKPEYPTMVFEAAKNDGSRYLYVASQSRIWWLNVTTGLWTLISSAGGGTYNPGLSQTRYKAAELQEVVVFVNNVDAPLWTAVSTGGVSQIADLGPLNITTAGVVAQFSGFMMLMDVVEDGVRQSSRIWWSDFNNPTAFNPGATNPGPPPTLSLSNFQDLDYGDQILAAVPMAGALYIFTTSAIWRCSPTGGADVFAFAKVYSDPQTQSKCLVYPNTLVSTGTAVWYASHEAVYYFDPFIPEPERQEWLFRGGSIMFSDSSALDPTCCQSPVACANTEEKEIYISWPELSANPNGQCVNSKTLVFNYQYQSCSIYDHGFSAIGNFRPSQADSAQCRGATQLLVAASVIDRSLKNVGVNFSREMLVNTGTGTVVHGAYVPFTGQYQDTGYYRIMRTLLPLVNFDREKKIRSVLMEAIPTVQVNPCVLRFRLGNTFSECDPNLPDGKCSVLWHQLKDLPLICLDTMTASQYVSANIRRDSGFEWWFLYSGRFLYAEWTISNSDGSPAVGGDCLFSRFEMDVQLQTK